MNERELLAIAGILVAVTIIGVLLVPGSQQEPTPPGQVEVKAVDIQPADVGGQNATLRTLSRLTHRGGTTDNISVEIRVVDNKTRLLVTEVSKK